MTNQFSLDFPCAYGPLVCEGIIKSSPEDFYVKELLELPDEDSGEHVYLWVRKSGQNTEYVADRLARFSGVRKMDVGLSGLKDRWAVTEQWFSIYLGNRSEPDWAGFSEPGVEILEIRRSNKKLRRGEHRGNFFRISIRDITSNSEGYDDLKRLEGELDERLKQIKIGGFPNYYGRQRFGHDGGNLYQAEKFFRGDIKASKSKRSFYLSATRSYLFNLVLADSVRDGTWNSDGAEAVLYGDAFPGARELNQKESRVFDSFPIFVDGLHRNRLKMDMRRLSELPKDLRWSFDADKLCLEFELPSGVFATSLMADLIAVKDVAGYKRTQ